MDLDPFLAHAQSGDLDAVKAALEAKEASDVSKCLKARDEDRRTWCQKGHEQLDPGA